MSKLYLDLDGVFADFETGAYEITGSKTHTMTPKELWRQIATAQRFFYHLKPLPEAIEAFELLYAKSKYDIEILTGIPVPTGNLKTCKLDKTEWVHKYLKPIPISFTTRRGEKSVFVENNTDILIDDTINNIIEWREVGGIGLHHENWTETLSNIHKLGII